MLQIAIEPPVGERLLLAAAIKPLEGQSQREAVKAVDRPRITADPVVLVMSSQLGFKGRPPFFHRVDVPHLTEPVV